jgi:hypothetical protein
MALGALFSAIAALTWIYKENFRNSKRMLLSMRNNMNEVAHSKGWSIGLCKGAITYVNEHACILTDMIQAADTIMRSVKRHRKNNLKIAKKTE